MFLIIILIWIFYFCSELLNGISDTDRHREKEIYKQQKVLLEIEYKMFNLYLSLENVRLDNLFHTEFLRKHQCFHDIEYIKLNMSKN